MLRWSDAWELASLKRLRDKWNLTEDEYFQRKYDSLGRRRHHTIITPLVKSVFRRRIYRAENLLMKLDHALNRYLTNRYARKHLQGYAKPSLITAVKPVMTASQR
jgi:hypothetical protein